MIKGITVLSGILLLPIIITAQAGKITVGFKTKPIIPSRVFRTGAQLFQNGTINYELSQKTGYSAGMTIRRDFNKRFSIESGISFTQRNFSITTFDKNQTFSHNDRFRIVGYEVPVTGLLYVRLGEYIYMNMAVGMSLDFFPSDVASSDTVYYQISTRRLYGRNRWAQLSSELMLGWEWRTEKNGTFYLGGTYHRPIDAIYAIRMGYSPTLKNNEVNTQLYGSYLTVDLRYYFHSDTVSKHAHKKMN